MILYGIIKNLEIPNKNKCGWLTNVNVSHQVMAD
jgi:hypothetical protein